jgi:hypothetical protein
MWVFYAFTLAVALAASSSSVYAWTARSSPESLPTVQEGVISTRRQFAKVAAAAFPALFVATSPQLAPGRGGGQAIAYERRDVGGNDRSPETAAMNEVAYRTNNRLEKAGFPLETAAEQSASLTSALSGMSYEASTTPMSQTRAAVGKDSNANSKRKTST